MNLKKKTSSTWTIIQMGLLKLGSVKLNYNAGRLQKQNSISYSKNYPSEVRLQSPIVKY